MNNKFPLVTIITPTYNRADFLEETIQSVLSQDYPNIEYIVLDDGSVDNTLEILREYGGQIIFESHPNVGETRTVNKGFRMVRGEIVCVVNSDDPLLPGAISNSVAMMQKHPEALAVYSDWNEIGQNSELIREHKLPDYNIFNMLTNFSVAMGPGTFFRSEVLDNIGVRDLEFKYVGDLYFWFRLALHGPLVHIPKALATHRTHSNSASSLDQGSQMAGELVRMAQKIFDNPHLPYDIRRIRSKIFYRVHYVATHYCGSHRFAKIKHKLLSIWYDPIPFCLVMLRPVYFKARSLFMCSINKNRIRFYKVKSFFLRGTNNCRVCMCQIKLFSLFFTYYLFLTFRSFFRFLLNYKRFDKKVTKFAFVSHILPPSWSGQAVTIRRLLNDISPSQYCLISKANYEVSKSQNGYIGRLPGKYYQLPSEHSLPGCNRLDGIKKINTVLAVLIRGLHIAQILKHERCTSVVAGTGDLIDLPSAYLASRLLRIPFYPYLFDDYVYQWSDPAMRTVARKFEKIIFKKIKKAIVTNEFLNSEIVRKHKVSTVIIHNSCESLNFKRDDKYSESSSKEIKIMYTGAIYHINFGAFRNLITAIDQLGLPNIKCHLYTAQPKAFLERENIFGENVVYHPHVPPLKAVEVQLSANILFLPFAFDSPTPELVKISAPGKLGDYLASGTPILAHGPADSFVCWYLRRFQCGVVVDQNNSKALMEAIKRLIFDDDFRCSLSRNARKRAVKDFSSTDARNDFLRILEK